MDRLKNIICRILCFGTLSSFIFTNVHAAPAEGLLDNTHAGVRAVMAVQRDVTPGLMRAPEILGTAIGLTDAGDVALMIYVDRTAPGASDAVRALPEHSRGIP